MTLSASTKLHNRELLNAAFENVGGRCHVCGQMIDRSAAEPIVWVRTADGGESAVKRLFTRATATRFAIELAASRPVHKNCHQPPPAASPPPRRAILKLKM